MVRQGKLDPARSLHWKKVVLSAPERRMGNGVTLVFLGRLRPESFTAFVSHRAGRLALEHAFGAVGPERVEVTLTGDPDLIDAFEMACSLGPIDCLVLDVFREGPDESRPAGTDGPRGIG
jgi:hypothetical protein